MIDPMKPPNPLKKKGKGTADLMKQARMKRMARGKPGFGPRIPSVRMTEWQSMEAFLEPIELARMRRVYGLNKGQRRLGKLGKQRGMAKAPHKPTVDAAVAASRADSRKIAANKKVLAKTPWSRKQKAAAASVGIGGLAAGLALPLAYAGHRSEENPRMGQKFKEFAEGRSPLHQAAGYRGEGAIPIVGKRVKPRDQ